MRFIERSHWIIAFYIYSSHLMQYSIGSGYSFLSSIALFIRRSRLFFFTLSVFLSLWNSSPCSWCRSLPFAFGSCFQILCSCPCIFSSLTVSNRIFRLLQNSRSTILRSNNKSTNTLNLIAFVVFTTDCRMLLTDRTFQSLDNRCQEMNAMCTFVIADKQKWMYFQPELVISKVIAVDGRGIFSIPIHMLSHWKWFLCKNPSLHSIAGTIADSR